MKRQTLFLTLAFCMAVFAAFFFSARAARTARHVRWQNEGIEPWMSVPFIAHTHHTRSEVLFKAIHQSPNPRDRRPLRDIAREEHVPVRDLIGEIEQAVGDTNAAEGR
jgi:hypothetical protein